MKRSRIALALGDLAPNMFNKVKIVFWYAYFAIRHRLNILPAFSINVRIVIFGHECRLIVSDISDFWTMKDVLVDKDYDVEFGGQPKVILDLGGNIGISSLYFALKYPAATVHVFEPDPFSFKRLEKNISGLSNVRAYQYAISAEPATVDFQHSQTSVHSSVVSKSSDESVIKVNAIDLDGALQLAGVTTIDICKFDIEGSERYIFDGFKGFKSVRNYIGEMHYDKMSLKPQDIRSIAEKNGYMYHERFIVPGKRSIVKIWKSSSTK